MAATVDSLVVAAKSGHEALPAARDDGFARSPAALEPPHVPRKLHILRKLSAKHTGLNSAFTFSNPRRLNCLNPSTLLIYPLGASTIHLLLR